MFVLWSSERYCCFVFMFCFTNILLYAIVLAYKRRRTWYGFPVLSIAWLHHIWRCFVDSIYLWSFSSVNEFLNSIGLHSASWLVSVNDQHCLFTLRFPESCHKWSSLLDYISIIVSWWPRQIRIRWAWYTLLKELVTNFDNLHYKWWMLVLVLLLF